MTPVFLYLYFRRDGAVAVEDQAVLEAGGNGRDVGLAARVGRGAGAPANDRLVGHQRQRVRRPGGDGRHLVRARGGHGRWRRTGAGTAVIYTLIENCRRHGVEPYSYPKDVGAPARHDQPGSRLTDAAQLKEGPSNTSQAGRLIFHRRPANPPSYPASPARNRGTLLYRLRLT